MIAKTPKIIITELIDENADQTLDTKIGSILPANTGYGNEPYKVYKEKFKQLFNKATTKNYKYWHQINNALQYNIDSVFVTNDALFSQIFAFSL